MLPLFRSIGLALGCLLLAGAPEAAGEWPVPVKFVRGDANSDGILSQADVVAVIHHFFFHTGGVPPCADAADFDDSGAVDVTDIFKLAHFLYLNGDYPAEPYWAAPGVDPTPDDGLPCRGARLVGGGEVSAVSAKRVDRDQDDGQVIDFIEFFTRRMEGYPGQTGIRVPILLSNATDIDGFTVCVGADPRAVWLEEIELPRHLPGKTRPEFSFFYDQRQAEGYLARSVFMDYVRPFEGNRFPRGARSTVAFLVFKLSSELKPGETVRVRLGDIPPTKDFRPGPINEVCVEGLSVRPALDPKGLEITVAPEGVLFIRGDPNRDRALNITDVILILRYLFIGGELECLDPADVDDSAKIDISDVIVLLSHLFVAGDPLTPPFPYPGRDPSADTFEDCQ